MSMKVLNIAEAKARLAEILRRAERGERIAIGRRNRPIVELRLLAQPPDAPRPAGLCRGEFRVPEDFNEPLPAEVVREFEGR